MATPLAIQTGACEAFAASTHGSRSVTATGHFGYAYGVLLCIADPPYLGQGRHYPEHPEAHVWNDPAAHLDLLNTIRREYDGWVLACSHTMLRLLLPAAPESVRVGVWAKSRAGGSRPNLRIAYSHEHTLFQQPSGRRGGVADMRRTDTVIAPATQRRGTVGAKPAAWTHWALDLLGYQPGEDQVTDLFPGSGDVQRAIQTYRPGCAWCTRPMQGRRDRLYCSARCRVAAYRARGQPEV